MKVGDYDDHDPNGSGYKIMTAEGLKIFDISEREEYEKEKELAKLWTRALVHPRKPRQKRLPDPTRQCRKCKALHSSSCIPPSEGPCIDFTRYSPPKQYRQFHYA